MLTNQWLIHMLFSFFIRYDGFNWVYSCQHWAEDSHGSRHISQVGTVSDRIRHFKLVGNLRCEMLHIVISSLLNMGHSISYGYVGWFRNGLFICFRQKDKNILICWKKIVLVSLYSHYQKLCWGSDKYLLVLAHLKQSLSICF